MRPLLESGIKAATRIWGDLLPEVAPAERAAAEFVDWVDARRADGLKVDGKPFTWDGFGPLRAVYEAIGTHREVDLIKSAQMGATVMELLSILWRAGEHPGTSHGFYFPTRNDVAELSKVRFRPLAEQCGGEESDRTRDHTKTVMVFQHAGSPIYMRYTEGRVSKDSIPLDSITFDELRLMNDADVDQILERISGSPHQWVLACSTAGYPDCDIDRRYKGSTMHRWLTRCPGCRFDFCMALEWPRCVAVDRDAGDVRYVCPRCTKPVDPLDGQWVAEYQQRDRVGFHLHQMLARHNTAARIWEVWSRTRNKAEFHKAKLGVPYLDATAVPLTLEQLRAQVDPDLRWQVRGTERDSFLGADQRGGEIHVLVQGAHRSRDGDGALRHVEVIQSDDPWVRLGDLMAIHDVDVAVVDALPSKNEAIRFAKRFPGRVFVAYYDTDPKTADVAKWGDRPKDSVFVRKAGEEARYRYTVRIARYLAIGWALDQWAQGRMWSPEPEALTQRLVVAGREERMSPVDSHHAQLQDLTLFKHLCSVAREQEDDEETGEVKGVRWVNLGLDPHFLHAYVYSCVARSRSGQRPVFLREPGKPLAERLFVQAAAPTVDDHLQTLVTIASQAPRPVPGAACGRCVSYERRADVDGKGLCKVHDLWVADGERPCDFFAPTTAEEEP